jgi:hypothetical protein
MTFELLKVCRQANPTWIELQVMYVRSTVTRLFCISTAALITNIPLTSWDNEMKFTEKIEKELIYGNNQNL